MPDQAEPETTVALEVVEEEVDLGPVVGVLRLQQLAPLSFNEANKSSAAAATGADGCDGGGGTDCTGQRVYAGCQVMVRFLAGHSWLVRDRTVVELGCGVGACGLALAGRLGARRVVLTDGMPSTVTMASANAKALGLLSSSSSVPYKVSVRRLLFGGPDAAVLAEELEGSGGGSGGGVDVVVGCELMYYNVDPAAVLATAVALLAKNQEGILLMAHIFRGAHLPQALLDAAEALRLWVLSVPLEAALSEGDRAGAASYWTNVSLLVCVPKRDDGAAREEAAAAAAAHAIARLRLPRGTKPFVPYEEGYDKEEEGGACLWLRDGGKKRKEEEDEEEHDGLG